MKSNFILLLASLSLVLNSGTCEYVETTANDEQYVWAHPDRAAWSEEFRESHWNWLLVSIGADSDNSSHFIGRAHFNGEVLPGKWKYLQSSWWQKLIKVWTRKIWVAHELVEYELQDFESLWIHPCAGSFFENSPSSNLSIPADAVYAGYTKKFEPIYVGGLVMDTKDGPIESPGQIIPSQNKMYGTYNGSVVEIPISNYVVVRRTNVCKTSDAHLTPKKQ